jgi:hypothetical protein
MRALGAPDDDAGIGEDIRRWCVAVEYDERGRGKDGEEEVKGYFLIYMRAGGNGWSEKVIPHLCGRTHDT